MATKPYNPAEIVRQIEAETADDFAKTAFAMLRNLIFASPVGNPTLWQNPSPPPGYVGGHFRRNWVVSIAVPSPGERDGIDPAGASTLAAGLGETRIYARGKIGRPLILQNNVPYASRLAEGHSTQAPAGWLDRAIDAALTVPGGRKDLG
jgi:hypothetical protein